MQDKQISLRSTGYISKLICDYTDRKENINHLYGEYPDINGFKNQIEKKRIQFSTETRKVLVGSINEQYKSLRISKKTEENIKALLAENAFTIVTGHQLNIFTGPLYFLFKIISTINLTKKLKEEFPENNFVPVYWMATEDHDFEEINHFFVGDSKFEWDVESSGVVGKHNTEKLDKIFEAFSKEIGTSENGKFLKELFQNGYLKHNNLTDATRYIVNELFGEHGLVIVDGDDKSLKTQFAPYVEKELFNEVAVKATTATNTYLRENYKVQVNPRDINLFYIKGDLRERIVFEKEEFIINNTSISFSKEEMSEELKNHPEYFSPNVIMRPLYQEVVLPNLCYIGGGGEIAYWLQLKELFVQMDVPFPVLLVRNSVLILNEKQSRKLEKLELSIEELFLKQDILIGKKTKELSELSIDFSEQKEKLKNMFLELHPLISRTDKTFEGALFAQEKKQLKGLNNLEKRLLKAEKKNISDKLSRIKEVQNELFPRRGLQERNVNFSEFYIAHGKELFTILFDELNPLSLEFLIITL